MGWYARLFDGKTSRCLVVAVAAVAIFMTPVEYRAGADFPHPHSMLQLIYEASRGIPMHHHALTFETDQQRTPPAAHASMRGDTVTHSETMQALPPGAGIDVAQQTDISLAVVVKLLTMLIPILIALRTWSIVVRVRSRALTLHGISVSPDSPPPQG